MTLRDFREALDTGTMPPWYEPCVFCEAVAGAALLFACWPLALWLWWNEYDG